MKCLTVAMPDGSRWAVPADLIARSRCTYYSKVDPFNPDSEEWREEWAYCFANGGQELKNWAAGNMDWSEVEDHAFKVRERGELSAEEKQEAWVNGDKRLEEIVVG
jgi:hypothetical protein